MPVEVARLWQGKSLERMGKALKEASRISEATGHIDSCLLNNLAALITASSLGMDQGEAVSTTILYNLARVYEDQGEELLAKDAYDKLVSRHPEYVDGRYLTFSLIR
ncbi:hypothetical protein DXG01_010536 [Tephrocybe rancida]|nr:hypothetical protein DXG01_010536 [Tephrocybe rancida]